MNWPEFITGIYEAMPPQPGIAKKPDFRPAAAAHDIADAEGRGISRGASP